MTEIQKNKGLCYACDKQHFKCNKDWIIKQEKDGTVIECNNYERDTDDVY